MPYVIGKDLKVPIINLYRKPEQVGQDRLVNAYAASLLYGKPLVIIDSGTAITLDAVSGKGQYLGGMIAPGMEVSLKSLKENTALLPLVKPCRPKGSIGSDTKNSMLSGVVLGTADLCRGLTGRLKQTLGKNARIIGTGGNIGLIGKYSGLNMEIDRELTLKGINLIYRNETKPA
jgi:type III pantothenate kinase